MKRVVLFIVVLSLSVLVYNSKAENTPKPLYSTITTSFVLSKTIKCDEVKARFRVYAEGDNYNMALQRLTKINNDFMRFLKKEFGSKDVKTTNAYGFGKTAMIYVSIHTKKINKIPSVLSYIANKNFQYKTGIKPLYIEFGVSNQLKQDVKNTLFLEALKRANAKLTVVNSILSNGYVIGSLDIGENAEYPTFYERNTVRTLYKSAAKPSNQAENRIQTSPGSITIKIKVGLKMVKKID